MRCDVGMRVERGRNHSTSAGKASWPLATKNFSTISGPRRSDRLEETELCVLTAFRVWVVR